MYDEDYLKKKDFLFKTPSYINEYKNNTQFIASAFKTVNIIKKKN